MKCPCHSNKEFASCCERYLLHIGSAETPEKLMRSRYSAYALDRPEYIIQTTHPKNPLYTKDTTTWTASIHLFAKTTSFRGLTIVSSEESGTIGFVTFFAHLIDLQGSDVSFREKSRFLKERGVWLYESGIRELHS